MGAPTWQSARHLLGEWEGCATELVVMDLPRSRLKRVVAALAELPDLKILTFGNEDVQEPFDEGWCGRVEATQAASCQHSLLSAEGTTEHLQIYHWIDGSGLEVELVFWNDMTFPPNLSPRERERRLSRLVSVAEACREGVAAARCVLSDEWNGTTQELLNRPGVLVW